MIALSTTEFEVCWQVLGLGPLPLVLHLPSEGRTEAERREVVAQAARVLRHPGLRPHLTTLAAHDWAVDSRVLGARRLRARGAAAGTRGVIAVHEGDHVVLRPMAADTVVMGMALLAGDVPAAPGTAVNVRADALDRVREPHRLGETLLALGERPADVRGLERLCAGAHTRGQFSVPAVKDVVAFHDTPAGRCLQLRRDGWVTVLPASTTQLADRIGQLLHGEGGRRAGQGGRHPAVAR
ncbi:EspG family protein [Lentzea fradiae]|uniref:EspG family protein n=1 Tax=Lentzea fradiae TaxID=200378 RepID=A0A1G7YDD6_9PSEU|nr:ESX secretion-associated protein EspG [Lentzea fradiae]SDG94355.1 EspG family protein [Lentzea fradiae]